MAVESIGIDEKSSWKDLVDFHLLFDADAVAAFEDAVMGKVYEVQSWEAGDYYLVPYMKDGLATGVIMLDAEDGHFKQATWTAEPSKYLPISEKKAAQLIKKKLLTQLRDDYRKKLITRTEYRDQYKAIIYAYYQATGTLHWEGGEYSNSPFMPFWKVEMLEDTWIVTQEGELEKLPSNNWCDGADINRDGTVDVADATILKESRSLICNAQNQFCNNADINQDGKADLTDMYILIENFGRTDCRQ